MPTPATRPIIRLGLQIPSFTFPGVPPDKLFEAIADIAVRAERSGFDSIWVMDHFYQLPMVGPDSLEMFDAYTLLAAIAARTSSAKLGTLVTGVTYRNPAHLAKIVTGLDVISGGRAILGIGAAWNESEHIGYGFDFPPTVERFERLEEAVQICRAMFTEERPSFQGKHYRIERALNSPRPLTPGGPPVLIGGGGEKRTLNLVARYADATNVFGGPVQIAHKYEVLRQHCEAVGRPFDEIERSTLQSVRLPGTAPEHTSTPAEIVDRFGELGDAGAQHIIFSVRGVEEPGRLETIGRDILPQLRPL